ncbi:hypothetical protein VD0001_g3331 [Verticillium dahliae]|nr:hypothetical protein VD0001_g3331 [Verticillium dahliae]
MSTHERAHSRSGGEELLAIITFVQLFVLHCIMYASSTSEGPAPTTEKKKMPYDSATRLESADGSICGIRRKLFWAWIAGGILIILLAVGVGVGAGFALNRPHHDNP